MHPDPDLQDEPWGQCASKQEWLLMYKQGVPPERVSDVCRVSRQTVRRYIRSAEKRDPTLFDRRLVRHDEPRLPKQYPRPTWDGQFKALERFVGAEGRFPSQLGPTVAERRLRSWLYRQRRALHAGTLPMGQVSRLDGLGQWRGISRHPNQWEQRLNELAQFVDRQGRWPRLRSLTGSKEHTLAIWLMTQRHHEKRGALSPYRGSQLSVRVPGWVGGSRAHATH
ncbi:helicase associated domain-containing protein [Arthrobacter sp. TMN-37]